MRATDRLLDVLHGVYERLIHWIFSAAAGASSCRRCPPTAIRSTPTARRDARAPRRLRFATITPRAVVVLTGLASFVVAIAIAPLVGTEFIPDSDNSYIRSTSRCRSARAFARQRQDAPGRGRRPRRCPRSAWSRRRSATPATAAATRRCSRSSSSSRTSESAASSEVEKAIRAALKPIPGIEVTLGNQPIYVALLGPRPGRARGRGAQARRQGREGARASPTSTTSVQARHPGVRGAAQARRGARARADDNAARLEPARLRQRRRRHLLDVARRRAGRRRAAPAAGHRARTSPSSNDLPVAYAKDGTPIALASVADVVAVTNPVVIKRQDLQRRQAIYAGTEGRPERRRRRRRAEDRQGDGSCRPATASTSAARRRTSRRRSSACCSRSPRR